MCMDILRIYYACLGISYTHTDTHNVYTICIFIACMYTRAMTGGTGLTWRLLGGGDASGQERARRRRWPPGPTRPSREMAAGLPPPPPVSPPPPPRRLLSAAPGNGAATEAEERAAGQGYGRRTPVTPCLAGRGGAALGSLEVRSLGAAAYVVAWSWYMHGLDDASRLLVSL